MLLLVASYEAYNAMAILIPEGLSPHAKELRDLLPSANCPISMRSDRANDETSYRNPELIGCGANVVLDWLAKTQ